MASFEQSLTIDALDRLPLTQVRYMLEEIQHSIVHLERSQEELLQAIAEVVDEDLADAYWENIEALQKKNGYVEKLEKYLEDNDLSFSRQNRVSLLQPPSAAAVDSEQMQPLVAGVEDLIVVAEEQDDFSVSALSEHQSFGHDSNRQEPSLDAQDVGGTVHSAESGHYL
jgi:hypothetical protein